MTADSATAADPLDVHYKPSIPPEPRPGIGIVGTGGIVKQAHLPAYQKYGLAVAGVYDRVPTATAGLVEQFGVGQVYASLDDLLDDPDVGFVDIATFPEQRIPLIREALKRGKHVLSQKPLALNMATARELVALADEQGRLLAVNQNGRWAPPWRVATRLLETGAIGDVVSITHTLDRSFRWTIGTHFEQVPHWAIYDYTVHWIDITSCWLGDKQPVSVRAREFRTPNQPPASLTPWGFWIEIACANGTTALLRGTGGEPGPPGAAHPFLICGDRGRIRGSVLPDNWVTIERGDLTTSYALEGAWYPDGFAGTMGELMTAAAEQRQPFNSARHNLRTLELTLAACRSAEQDGAPVALGGG